MALAPIPAKTVAIDEYGPLARRSFGAGCPGQVGPGEQGVPAVGVGGGALGLIDDAVFSEEVQDLQLPVIGVEGGEGGEGRGSPDGEL